MDKPWDVWAIRIQSKLRVIGNRVRMDSKARGPASTPDCKEKPWYKMSKDTDTRDV